MHASTDPFDDLEVPLEQTEETSKLCSPTLTLDHT